MISKTGEAETITSHYLFALGSYRALYILNWIYRYYSEGFLDLIAVVAGCIQTVLYCDFFYLYITKGIKIMTLHVRVRDSDVVLLLNIILFVVYLKCTLYD